MKKSEFTLTLIVLAAVCLAILLYNPRPKFATSSMVTFDQPVKVRSGKRFGPDGQFTFELFRKGTFVIDKQAGCIVQKSVSYRDSAWIRSTYPLPENYRIRIELGEIDYDLEAIQGLRKDPEYSEGPQNENGVYLLTITDAKPTGPYTNAWWHKHRKVTIDVDNNVWGSGMPNPIFMIYYDPANEQVAFDGEKNAWSATWLKAWQYDKKAWYTVEIEKTAKEYILRLYSKRGVKLKEANVPHEYVWHSGKDHPEYFVVGDPHENYYQGSLKIRSIQITAL